MKGVVERVPGSWPQRFTARFGREARQRRLLPELVDRALGGSANALVLQALAGARRSASEREEIRRVLDEAERDASTCVPGAMVLTQ